MLVFLGAVAAGLAIDGGGFPGNLLAEIAGVSLSIIFALVVVEWFLDFQRKRAWSKVDWHIQIEISTLVSESIIELSRGFKLSSVDFDKIDFNMSDDDLKDRRKDPNWAVMREGVIDSIDSAMDEISNDEWKHLPAPIQETQKKFGRLLEKYGHRLGPERYNAILNFKTMNWWLERDVDMISASWPNNVRNAAGELLSEDEKQEFSSKFQSKIAWSLLSILEYSGRVSGIEYASDDE